MTAALPLLVALAGLLCYALSSNGKVSEAGRLAYFAGLLAFLLTVGAGKAIHLF